MAEHSNFLQVGQFSCAYCDFKCNGTDSEKVMAHTRTHPENTSWEENEPDMDMLPEAKAYNKGWDAGVKQARSEVLAACIERARGLKHDEVQPQGDWDKGYAIGRSDAAFAIKTLQPAAADLEELTDKAHEAALPHAAEQLLKAMTEGGEFAVDSPLAKVKQRVEELLRHEREKYTKLVDEYGDHAGACDVSNSKCTCGWEKARAILEKP